MKSRFLSEWIRNFLDQHPARARSLIITVYGDLIAAHGGTVWLGSFIRLMEPLGLNERTVRTSVYRLSKEKWLVSEQRGRKSHYSLTPSGRRRFEHAYRRIYFEPRETWAGEWQLVMIPSSLDGAQRDALRKELAWAGYGALASGMLAHPSADTEALLDILEEIGAHDKVVALKANNITPMIARPLLEIVQDCWNLDVLAERYEEFIGLFRPVLRSMRAMSSPDPEQLFLIQTLLMHSFRRALLHDPQLPSQLLPSNWSGGIARALCRDIYRITYPYAEQHLMSVCETVNGRLPPAAPQFYDRFGGLEGAPSADGVAEPGKLLAGHGVS
ncbi:MAG: phenylacetic acid degradation operon negative regulatory protein PaaX [Xanthomonadales bacterium]|nr:phenylacetic acid degradation operon negative regulatory protein PaaX [Xanthomonadales bacterium]